MSASSRATTPYVSGLAIAWASNTTLTVAAGQCSDSSNSFDIKAASALTINAAVVGANGIDTGALGASTVYNVFVIWQQVGRSTPAAIISTSSTPIMPEGYDLYRRIGYTTTDGSSHFLLMYQYGSGLNRKYIYDAPISILSAGNSATYAATSLAAAVPAISTLVTFDAEFTPNAAGDTAALRPSGSASTTFCIISSVAAAKEQKMQIQVPSLVVSSVAKIDYLVTASGALDLFVVGFNDYL
jgi:hypothetical protein